uniref:DUF4757 domain-containing protein n=1 Tax=Oncorhynchus tshawytscha TaxID=74940 RepID=A0AAZ3QC02_ONCTS
MLKREVEEHRRLQRLEKAGIKVLPAVIRYGRPPPRLEQQEVKSPAPDIILRRHNDFLTNQRAAWDSDSEGEAEGEEGGGGVRRVPDVRRDDLASRRAPRPLTAPRAYQYIPPPACSLQDRELWEDIRRASHTALMDRMELETRLSRRVSKMSEELESISIINMHSEEEGAGLLQPLGQSRYDGMQEQYSNHQEEEEWQDDLARWKSRRRSASQDLIRKEEERKRMERMMKEEEGGHTQKKKNIKTYREIVEDKERREAELCDAYRRAGSKAEAAMVLQRYALRFTISDSTLDSLQLPRTITTDQNPESRTPATNQNPEFRTTTTNQNPESRTPATNQNPESRTITTNQNPESRTITTNHNPESKTITTDQNPESRTITTNQNPESRTITTNHNPESKTITTDQNPESRTFSTDQNPKSRTITSDQNPESRTITADRNSESRTITTDQNPNPRTIITNQNPESRTITADHNPDSDPDNPERAGNGLEALQTDTKQEPRAPPKKHISVTHTQHTQLQTQNTQHTQHTHRQNHSTQNQHTLPLLSPPLTAPPSPNSQALLPATTDTAWTQACSGRWLGEGEWRDSPVLPAFLTPSIPLLTHSLPPANRTPWCQSEDTGVGRQRPDWREELCCHDDHRDGTHPDTPAATSVRYAQQHTGERLHGIVKEIRGGGGV